MIEDLNKESKLKELLEQMHKTAGKPETSTSFEDALDLYTKRLMRMQDAPTRYRAEIKDAKEFLDQNDIEGLDMQNMRDHIEMLELALS